ncbi:MAG: CMP-N-acetlyneuraminic acid synthetase [Omnitrophica WOR_2 bacterium SM23_29]|nr:MAG: CMP-N-acetlyneuraminic acid synthetase [Omnitrophica WOR_2 bacterium SM23_29]
MFRNKKILALIPARGGSKGLHRKNMRPLLGKPLILWTIEQAKNSKYIDRIIVSTDDKEIARISKKYGAEVPFMRPKKLAGDNVKGIKVVSHAVAWLQKNNSVFELLMLLQPTSPLRTSKDIDAAIKLLFKKNAQAVISITETDHHPYFSNTLPSNGRMANFLRPESINKNRQELPAFYRLNGAIYLAYVSYIKKKKNFLGKNTFAYTMPSERSIDIDSEIDFKLAELLLRERIKVNK